MIVMSFAEAAQRLRSGGDFFAPHPDDDRARMPGRGGIFPPAGVAERGQIAARDDGPFRLARRL